MFIMAKLTIHAERYLIYLSLTLDSRIFLEPACACQVPCTTYVTICIATLCKI